MRLLHLEVWNWRGLDHAALLELAPDLNLVVGPNESGKSRLFEALRYALFERYKGDSEEKKRLRSWDGSESPRVVVEFEAEGKRWRVEKRFLKGATATLQGAGATWIDDDAERELRRIWGTREIKGRKDLDQFMGLWPLLWVEQGKASQAPNPALNEDSRTRLRDALSVEVNEVAAGPRGQRLRARAKAERDLYFTERTGKETGDLERAREKKADMQASLEKARTLRDAGRAASDELARVESLLREAEPKIALQRGLTAEARQKVAEGKRRAASVDRLGLEVAALRARVDTLERQRAEHDAWERDLSELAQKDAEQAAALASLEERRADVAARLEVLGRRVEEAERAEQAARATHVRATARARLVEVQSRAERTLAALEDARGRREQERRLAEELASLRIGAKEMKELRRARDEHVRASAALEASSARVRIRALADLVVDGTPLEKGGERRRDLDEPSSIVIAGVAEIHISPAGTELHRLRDRERDAREALEVLLTVLGASSFALAEESHHRRIQVETEKAQLASSARGGPGESVEALEDALRTARAELTAFGPDDLEVSSPVAVAEEDLAARVEATRDARLTRDALDRQRVELGHEASMNRQLAVEREARTAAMVAKRAAWPKKEDLAASLAEATKAWAAGDALFRDAERETRLDASSEVDLERHERALLQLQSQLREAQDKRIALATTVEHMGAEGIHEELQRLEAEVESAARDLKRVERRAIAARTLFDALVLAEREVQERLIAPVREKVAPYLAGLLPGVQLSLDDDWHVKGLEGATHEETFESLSFGAQEQVSLVVRLALAEVLGQRESLPVVLDDCLVNTDRERQEDMLRILFQASKKQQIVLFSCHDSSFERLGPTRRYELPARRTR
jgi:energy-coupling factor transporter ATP-binding protein EcfA2